MKLITKIILYSSTLGILSSCTPKSDYDVSIIDNTYISSNLNRDIKLTYQPKEEVVFLIGNDIFIDKNPLGSIDLYGYMRNPLPITDNNYDQLNDAFIGLLATHMSRNNNFVAKENKSLHKRIDRDLTAIYGTKYIDSKRKN